MGRKDGFLNIEKMERKLGLQLEAIQPSAWRMLIYAPVPPILFKTDQIRFLLVTTGNFTLYALHIELDATEEVVIGNFILF